jgi:hypothetical protein
MRYTRVSSSLLCLSFAAAPVFRLMETASLLAKVVAEVRFVDGVEQTNVA